MGYAERKLSFVKVDFDNPVDRGRFLAPLTGPNRKIRGRLDSNYTSDVILLEGISMIISNDDFEQACKYNEGLVKSFSAFSPEEIANIN